MTEQLNVIDLFSGLGGMSLGLERTGGFKTVAFCEIDTYCQKVLKRHWPDVPMIEDVKNVTPELLSRLTNGAAVDVITGGFPCQPFSEAGQQRGSEDERYLWPEIARLVRLLRPQYVILENVSNLLSINRGAEFGLILGELASVGYDAEWQMLPACAFGAPHERDRLWIVAYPTGSLGIDWEFRREDSRGFDLWGWETQEWGTYRQESKLGAPTLWGVAYKWEEGARKSDVPRVVDGLPDQLERNKACGNSIVPVIPQYIGERIIAARRAAAGGVVRSS